MNSLLPRDIDKKKSYQYYIQKAKSVRGKFALSQYSFLSTLCKNLQNPQNFCDAYLSKNYFQKIINGERPMAHLQGRCQGLLNKNVLSSTDLNECLSIMQAKPQNCHFATWKIYPSLAPSSDCNSISTALLSSRLSAEYQDCPAKIVNTAITNAHRILKHFKENPKGSDSGKKSTNTNSEVLDTKYCASESSHAIAQMILDFGSNKIWNYTLCYFDHFKNAEVCLPFALGEFPESKLSENLVIAQVLREGQGANEKLNCKLVSKKEFRPNLLEYRYGCNIVYDDNNCNALECPKTIYLNQNIVKQITEHKGANFYYLPINLKDDLLTLTYILEQSQNIKSVVINNYTQLENFFKEERHGIIHGQGCIEDILPQFFRRAALNQCRPISFIIDGVIFDQNAMAVVLRLPIDEVHSPRIVDWNFLYLSVYNYQNLHPLRLWTLYGLKK